MPSGSLPPASPAAQWGEDRWCNCGLFKVFTYLIPCYLKEKSCRHSKLPKAALAIAELADLYGIVSTPHTSNSAIGIAAALQIIACLPPYTRSPSTLEPLLEYGIDDNPWRRDLLKEDFSISDGWVTIPTEPGLGIDIAEDRLRTASIEHLSGGAQ